MNPMKTIKRLILKIVKPSVNAWSGKYASWQDALNNCAGYNQEAILEKCKDSLLQVKNGSAVYERDSVLFDEIQYSWPLLSALLLVAAKNNGNLTLIDFGGSLGSTYFQNRYYLNELNKVNYNIVSNLNQIKIVIVTKKKPQVVVADPRAVINHRIPKKSYIANFGKFAACSLIGAMAIAATVCVGNIITA